jgi:DNA-binding transcriptional MerR regulator
MNQPLLNESIFTDFDFLGKLVVGIGEVSEITGVPQRQIRYWEDKGFIKAVSGSTSSTRRYDYINIKKIVSIQSYQAEGFTLEAAVRKHEERYNKAEQIFRKLAARVKTSSTNGLPATTEHIAVHAKQKHSRKSHKS